MTQKPTDHAALKKLADWSDAELTALESLLFAINAPSQLKTFLQILNNLKPILEDAKELARYSATRLQPWDTWIEIVSLLLDRRSDMVAQIGDHVQAGTARHAKRPPIHGYMTRHPLYSMLYFGCRATDQSGEYIALQAHVFLAHITLLENQFSQERYQTSLRAKQQSALLGTYNSCVDQACRSIRREGEAPYSYLLETLAPQSHNQKFFIHEIHSNNRIEDSETGLVNDLRLLFERAYSDEEPKSRSGGGRKQIARHMKIYGYVPDIPNMHMEIAELPGNGHPPKTITVIPTDGDPHEGLHPVESGHGTEYFLYFGNCRQSITTAATQTYAAVGRARHTALANQLLPQQWNQLTLTEIAEVMHAAGKEFRRLRAVKQLDTNELKKLATICILMVMVWTGSSLNRALKLRLTDANERIGGDIAYIAATQEWKIKTVLPSYRTTPSDSDISQARTRSEYVFLPDLFGIGRYLAVFRSLAQPENSTLFGSLRRNQVQLSLRDFLGTLPEGNRATESRLSSYLFHRLLAHSGGDAVASVLICGIGHHTAVVPSYYSTPSVEHLRKTYQDGLQERVSLIYSESKKDLPVTTHEPTPRQDATGARNCPTSEAIQSLVIHLKTTLNASQEKDTYFQFLRQFHNYYTLYTALFLGFGTGIRSIRDPFIDPDSIDVKTGFAVISDKDGDDHYKSRLVWVPDTVRQQLEHYLRHRRKLINTLSVFDEFQGKSLRSLSNLFLFGPDLEILEFSPATAAPLLQTVYPLPLNSNRRYLRTFLMERQCPADVMDAFLGHWKRGAEPWGVFATLSPDEYQRTISTLLNTCLKQLGWTVERGMA